MRKLKPLSPYLCLIAAAFLVYANAFSNQFLFDDEFLILKNSFLRQWSTFFDIFRASSTTGAGGVDSFYRPLQTICYFAIYQIFDLSPFGFHLLNVGLHAANACLVFALGSRLGFQKNAAYFAALLWAVHPLHTEAVTYMSATADTLYTFFCLAGCAVLLPDFNWKRVGGACILFAFGLLSKEAAIVFPALTMAICFIRADRKWSPRTYRFTIPFWILAVTYLIARKTILNFDDTFHFYKSANLYSENFLYRLYTFFATLPSYFSVIIWPTDLHMERRFPVFTSFTYAPVLAGCLLVLLTLTQIAIGRGRRGIALSFGFLWLWAAHSPHTGVLLPVNAFFLEHWMYLPLIGLFLGVAQQLSLALDRVPQNYRFTLKRVSAGIVIIAAVLLGQKTRAQNEVWATPFSFYTNILKYNPLAVRAHNNLAMAYGDARQRDEAMKHYLLAISISDEYPQTHYNLALLYLDAQLPDQALNHLKRATEIDPNFYYAYARLHDLYLQKNEKVEAEKSLNQFRAARRRLGFSD